ncbi:hypothetical protein Pla108_00210 [Botrimarina colliarenosi]|uniref:Uncharacterized protein n=1 Tax=Botrimarina colliarenosi TaxID=2528001 RepID=A0A5C6AIM2_9BACT|nr:hypothetical protein [Botrimarina colliarenosi]TWT99088.1 hypothetical protein Pla108_00210 [Botrimarina colliarenosi]
MRKISGGGLVALGDADWDFFLPDDDETYPEPGDFWIERDDED